MTKNRSIKIAVLVLALALITSCFVGTTFAKYTSTVSGNDLVSIAQWKFSGDATVNATTETLTFDLFGDTTILDEEGGATETDVKAGMIAPGTKGAATLDFVNESEVNATYGVVFTLANATDADIKIRALYTDAEGNEQQTAWGATATVPATAIAMNDGAENGDDEASVTIEWMWAYEVDAEHNTNDTTAGKNAIDAANEVQVTAAVTFTQVQ